MTARLGRPPISPSGVPLARVEVRLEPAEIAKLDRLADAQQISRAEVIRTIISIALEGDTMTATSLDRTDFAAAFAAAPAADLRDGSGNRIAEDAAWEVYSASPADFHRVTGDNLSGDVVAALVLIEGPHWMPEDEG